MKKNKILMMITVAISVCGCAHAPPAVTPAEAAKLSPDLVKDSVVYEAGTEKGAVVPEISAPRLRAILVPERREGNRLIEQHREWLLEGDVVILGVPKGKPGNHED